MGQLGNQSAASVTGNDLLEIHFTRLEVRKVIWEVFVVAYLAMIKDSDQGNLERRGFTWPVSYSPSSMEDTRGTRPPYQHNQHTYDLTEAAVACTGLTRVCTRSSVYTLSLSA